MLRASQVDRPPRVLVERGSDIPNEVWFQISQTLSPGRAVRQDQPLLVELMTFLGERRRLVAICHPRGIDFEFDDRLRALLERIRDEEQSVTSLLSQSAESNPGEPPSESRFKRS